MASCLDEKLLGKYSRAASFAAGLMLPLIVIAGGLNISELVFGYETMHTIKGAWLQRDLFSGLSAFGVLTAMGTAFVLSKKAKLDNKRVFLNVLAAICGALIYLLFSITAIF